MIPRIPHDPLLSIQQCALSAGCEDKNGEKAKSGRDSKSG